MIAHWFTGIQRSVRCGFAALSLGSALLVGCASASLEAEGETAEPVPSTATLSQGLQSTVPQKVRWHVTYGQTRASVSADHTALRSEYSLSVLNGYDDNGSSRFTLLWDRVAKDQRIVVDKSQADFATEHEANRVDGYIPTFVDAHRVGSSVKFSGIYEKVASPPATILRYNMTSDILTARNEEYEPLGYKLAHLAGYDSNGSALYAGIWSKASSPAVKFRVGLDQAQLAAAREELKPDGYHLTQVDVFQVGSVRRHAGIWLKEPLSQLRVYAFHGNKEQLEDGASNAKYTGLRPISLSSSSTGSSQRYVSIWRLEYFTHHQLADIDETVLDLMEDSGVRGLSLAVSRGGKLRFAKGYGVANSATNEPMDADSVFRYASVAKPITASAVMRLIQEGEFELDTPVFGDDGLLGDDHEPPGGYPARVRALTVDHFLTHTTGGWGQSYKRRHEQGDTVTAKPALSRADLITWVIANQPQDFDPGTDYDYSNFGYLVLGHVIEKVTGDSYEHAVRELTRVTSPSFEQPAHGETLPREVTYYQDDQIIDNAADPILPRSAGASNWAGTPADFLQFLRRFDGMGNWQDVLTEESRELMLTPSEFCQDGGGCDYARGWHVRANEINHGGYIYGMSSLLVLDDDGIAWSLATNDVISNGINLRNVINGLRDVMDPDDWGTHDFLGSDSLWNSVAD